LEILARNETRDVLHETARVLWQSIDTDWETWLRARFKSTLGAALVEAACSLCPQMDSTALIVDLNVRNHANAHAGPTSSQQTDELWISEATIGGGGFLEEFLARYTEDPRKYFRLMDAVLAPSDLE